MLFYYYVCLTHCSCTEQGIKVALLATQEARAKEDRGRQVRTSPSTVVHQNRCVSFQCDAKLKTLDPALPDLTAPPAPSPSTASFHPGPAPPPPTQVPGHLPAALEGEASGACEGCARSHALDPGGGGGGGSGQAGQGQGAGGTGTPEVGRGAACPGPWWWWGGAGPGPWVTDFQGSGAGAACPGKVGKAGQGQGCSQRGMHALDPGGGAGLGSGGF